MSDIEPTAKRLSKEVGDALERMHFDSLIKQKQELDAQVQSSSFWDNPQAAQKVIRQQTKFEQRIDPWLKLRDSLNDLLELIPLSDKSLDRELESQLEQATQQFTRLKDELKLSGRYDDYDAILNIYAGAGGTDAQDWASMLLRMYVRWAESKKFKISSISETAGDEAGIKSATIEIDGSFAYGRLKGEQGVHRLVRLSPFNS